MSPSAKKAIAVGLSVGGLAGSVWVLSRMVDLPTAFGTLANARKDWMAAAILVTLLAPVLVGYKLWLVLKLVDYRTTFGRCWSAVLAAVTLNAVLPGRGGDFVRAAFLAEGPGTLSLLVGAVLVERLLDVFILGVLALVASAAGDAGVVPFIAAGVCVAAVVAIALLAAGRRLPVKREAAERAGRAARALLEKPKLTLAILGMTVLAWANNVASMDLCLRAVGADLPVAAVYRATPIAVLASIVPVSVSGIGTRDAAMLMLLGPYGQKEQVVAGTFAYFILNSWLLALFGLTALGRETLRRVQASAEAARAPRSADEAPPVAPGGPAQ